MSVSQTSPQKPSPPCERDTRPAHLRNRFKKLTVEQKEELVKKQQKKEEEWRNPTWGCKECGPPLNGGTYGVIFEHKKDSSKIVKGSREPHAENVCPVWFENEYLMRQEIADALESVRGYHCFLNKFRVVRYDDMRVENRRCFIDMDKIEPIASELYMLAAGLDADAFDLRGTSTGKGWRELGKNKINWFLSSHYNRFYGEYARCLGAFVSACHALDVVPQDVEYFAAKIGDEKIIAVVDFDKTFSKHIRYEGEGGGGESPSVQRLAKDIKDQDMYDAGDEEFIAGYLEGAEYVDAGSLPKMRRVVELLRGKASP